MSRPGQPATAGVAPGGDLPQPAPTPRPALRGVVHAATFPLALAAGIVLVVLAPTGTATLGAAVYSACAAALFGVSALYHLGRFSARRSAFLRRLDHSNIYLLIAGTYTPFALLALEGWVQPAILWAVWGGALAGAASRLLWLHAPRWVYTPIYVLLGWIAALIIPQLLQGAGVAAVVLCLVGGVLYSLGGLVYALRRPNPLPRLVGFHEVFHVLTVAAFVVQYVAVSLLTYSA